MGKGAPKADPRIGEAALKSAEIGERYLGLMRGLSDTTMGWAREDRERYERDFRPLEERFINDAATYDTPERRAAAITESVADVRQQTALQAGARERSLAAVGVNPASGRFAAEDRRADAGAALAGAGAANLARKQVEATADAKIASAVNLGRGSAASATTGTAQAGSMLGAGHQGAMSGYGQMGSLLNTQYQQQMQSWNAQQGMLGGIGGALGSIAGAFLSDENAKTEKRRPAVSILDAVRDMPVEEWEYKAGMGDGGGRKHIGPYAQDFAEATGLGDGKTISIIDALGVSLGAVQELADKVDRIEQATSGGRARALRHQPVSIAQ